jgi:signal transduction histidine kinase
LTQVVDNLLENAVKFSPTGGHVWLRLTPWKSDAGDSSRGRPIVRAGRLRGGAVLLTISDEGPGVPEDERDRVFTRFYQTEAGRAAHGKGVGLGLTICREIVSAHGGEIWVSDNEPRGSTFCVLLPGAVRPSETPVDSTVAVALRSTA